MTVSYSSIRDTIPSTPGVYFFNGPAEEVLYVGKAANLKVRLRSYFSKGIDLSPAKRRMVRQAVSVTWQETESEIDALIREASLIKHHHPRYNIILRDDKNYSFVAFTKEPFPRVYITHQPVEHGAQETYIGPFTDGYAVKRLLRTLRRSFPYCTCAQQHTRACQNAELRLCMNFCCLKNQQSEVGLPIIGSPTSDCYKKYRKNIAAIKTILRGKHTRLKAALMREMSHASKTQDFEAAGQARDQLYALQRIFAHREVIKKEYRVENQKGLHALRTLLKLPRAITRIEGYDISNIQGVLPVGSMVVFTNGMSNKQEYRKFKIKSVRGANDPAMIREIITRRLAHADWPLPDIMLIDGGKTQLNAALAAQRASSRHETQNITIMAIAKREEELYLVHKKTPLALKTMPVSLLHLLQQVRNEAHRFAIGFYRKRHRATVAPNSVRR